MIQSDSSKRCFRSTLVVVGWCLVVAAGPGCPKSSLPSQPTPAQYFEKTQATMPTPHGRVVPGSAQDTDDGRIKYQTEDGRYWTTRYSSLTGDTYTYFDAQPADG